MKKAILSALILFGLTILGCSKLPLPTPPVMPSTPTATPSVTPTATPITTPACGFIPFDISVGGFYTTDQNFVIQDATQWAAVNGASAALPPVDFSKQMVLEIRDWLVVSCGCSAIMPSISSVCYYTDHIEVDYQEGGAYCPPPVGPVIVTCNSVFSYGADYFAAIPQSSLPVTWIAK